MKRLLTSITALIILCLPAWTQDFGIEVQNDKKTIVMSRLNLPPSTTVYEIIHLMPELLYRDGTRNANYTIKVNGMVVNEVLDALVGQLRLCDVEKIDICESASDSYSKGGESGSVNITLKKPDKKIEGNFTVDACAPMDIIPGLMVGSHPKNWYITGIVKGDFNKPNVSTEHIWNTEGMDYTTSTQTSTFNQTARVIALYRAPHNEVDITAGEGTTYSYTEQDNIKTENAGLIAQTHVMYKHKFASVSELLIEGDGSFTPKGNIVGNSYSGQVGNVAAAHIDYLHNIIKTDNSFLKAKCGVNYDHSITLYLDSDENANHAMPYAKIDGKFGKLSFIGEIDWHYYSLDDSNNGKQKHNDWTGVVSTSYHFTPNHMARLLGRAQIQRQNKLSINPIKIYGLNLNYVGNGKVGKGSWMAMGGAGYITVKDVRTSGSGGYDNSRIWQFDALAQYNYGITTISLTGNIYSARRFNVKDFVGAGTYGNISLRETFNFRNEVHATAAVTYNSKVYFSNSDNFGDTCCLGVIVGKRWGQLDAHIYGRLNLTGETTDTTTDTTTSNKVITYTSYLLFKNYIGVGMRYSF